MNKKLKELAERAGINFGNFESVTVDIDEVEHFAKLIMEECGNACNDINCGRTVSSQELIAGHFGISE